MPVRVAINGFGRIGRLTLRVLHQRYAGRIQVVALNKLEDPEISAHLLRWDSNFGPFPQEVTVAKDRFIIGGQEVLTLCQPDPTRLPWEDLGVDVVIESSGAFKDAARANRHLEAGAKRVLITAPAKNEDVTIVLGVNEHQFDPEKHRIISSASCTTNCLAPVAKVLMETAGIVKGTMVTVHAATNDQRVADRTHKDRRRARASLVNIIPTTTGAAKALGRVLPELQGRLHGLAYRVPTATVSVVDLTVLTSRATSAEELNEAFLAASQGPLRRVLGFTEQQLVSSDFCGNPLSAVIDGPSTSVIDGDLAKVVAWYDNEWAYSNRVADVCEHIAGCSE